MRCHWRTAEVLLALILPFLIGCRGVDRKITKTGLFENKTDVLLSAYSKIEPGITTRGDLEKTGFNFQAPNINSLAGQDAFKYLFGKSFSKVRDSFMVYQTKESAEVFLDAIKTFYLYIIPYQDIEKAKDRIWWSTKYKTQRGLTLQIVLMFNKDNVVVYRGLSLNRIDTLERSYGFLHGILRFIFMDDPEEAFDEVTK